MLHVGDRVTYNEAGAIVRYVPETPPCKVASRGCPCRRGRRRRLASRWFGRLC
jgi:hypothetical protein